MRSTSMFRVHLAFRSRRRWEAFKEQISTRPRYLNRTYRLRKSTLDAFNHSLVARKLGCRCH